MKETDWMDRIGVTMELWEQSKLSPQRITFTHPFNPQCLGVSVVNVLDGRSGRGRHRQQKTERALRLA
jgi:hypothetical protein